MQSLRAETVRNHRRLMLVLLWLYHVMADFVNKLQRIRDHGRLAGVPIEWYTDQEIITGLISAFDMVEAMRMGNTLIKILTP